MIAYKRPKALVALDVAAIVAAFCWIWEDSIRIAASLEKNMLLALFFHRYLHYSLFFVMGFFAWVWLRLPFYISKITNENIREQSRERPEDGKKYIEQVLRLELAACLAPLAVAGIALCFAIIFHFFPRIDYPTHVSYSYKLYVYIIIYYIFVFPMMFCIVFAGILDFISAAMRPQELKKWQNFVLVAKWFLAAVAFLANAWYVPFLLGYCLVVNIKHFLFFEIIISIFIVVLPEAVALVLFIIAFRELKKRWREAREAFLIASPTTPELAAAE